MKDTIHEDDLYIDVTKTELEKEFRANKDELEHLKSQLTRVEEQLRRRERFDPMLTELLKNPRVVELVKARKV